MELHTSHGAIIPTAMLLASDNILGKLYIYTPDGIRSSKTVNGTKTEYLLNGTQILAQKTGSDVMWFFYDSTGTRIGVQQGNVTAYYMYNLQGDVVGLADAATGKIIAKHLYDAWGKCVSVENADGYTIGTANPFRYRGYYYDNETGFYYLNSRYYNPEVGRFVNSDAYATTNVFGLLGSNMFSYCYNNPIKYSDDNGRNPVVAGAIIGGLFNAGIAIYDQVTNYGEIDWTYVGISAAFGAAEGASFVMNPAGMLTTLSSIGYSTYDVWYKSNKTGDFDGAVSDMVVDIAISKICSSAVGKIMPSASKVDNFARQIGEVISTTCGNILYSVGEALFNLLSGSGGNNNAKKPSVSKHEVKIHALGA